MAPSDVNSGSSTPKLDVNVAQLRIPDGMAVEDVVPKHLREFLWRKNQARLDQARRLNLDLGTLSISPKTTLILFHSLTDEEMDPQHSENAGPFKASDFGMWKRYMDDKKNHVKNIKFLPLGNIAHVIVEDGGRYEERLLTKLVKTAHRQFIQAAYPLDIILSISKSEISSHRLDLRNMDNWLKGSAQTGHIAIEMVRESIAITCPLDSMSSDWNHWHAATVNPVIAFLERFTKYGVIGPLAYGRLETLSNDLPSKTPEIIQQYLGTLPEAKQVHYWAAHCVYMQKGYGFYEEDTVNYLDYPKNLKDMILQEISRHTKQDKMSMSTTGPPSKGTDGTSSTTKLKRLPPLDDGGLSPRTKRSTRRVGEAIPSSVEKHKA